MQKKLVNLERQISSLEGANLEITVRSNSNILHEVKSFISTYGTADVDSLAKL